MTDEEGKAEYEAAIRTLRGTHPGHTDKYYDMLLLRMAHYIQHKGDMSGAPPRPED